MKKFLKIISILILLMFYSFGFAQTDLDGVPKRFHKDFAQNGLIVGSITFPKEKARFNGYFIQIKSDTDSKSKSITEIHISPEQFWRVRHDGHLDDKRTYLFVLELPVGSSSIVGIRLFSNSGIAILQRTYNKGGFSIPFDVKKGEITYVGNLFFNEYASENEAVVSYENNYEKDINKLKELKPLIDWSQTVNYPEMKIEYLNEK